ncbi:flagellar biosynthesis protein FliQ [Bartonella sp. DGB2]|uniref:flagellar biosynthesis protein FliQ n=1 Tax=Bartonella sp. DGB2 TaxID=3388426 RepID=UPI0039900198
MNEADAIEMVTAAIWTVLITSGPAIVAAMLVGIIIALFQALTQIQEMTLTFIPKIVIIFVVLAFTGPFIGGQIYAFTQLVYGRIESSF